MANEQFVVRADAKQALALIAEVDREIRAAEGHTNGPMLTDSWKRLVELLAIETPAERRACPSCGSSVAQAATLCGFCWVRLER